MDSFHLSKVSSLETLLQTHPGPSFTTMEIVVQWAENDSERTDVSQASTQSFPLCQSGVVLCSFCSVALWVSIPPVTDRLQGSRLPAFPTWAHYETEEMNNISETNNTRTKVSFSQQYILHKNIFKIQVHQTNFQKEVSGYLSKLSIFVCWRRTTGTNEKGWCLCHPHPISESLC